MPVKILLADKSITIQKVVEMLFSGKDYQVSCVSDGETAFNEASRILPDVVLVDIDLPRLDGYGFSARLKQVPALSRTPVILMMSRDDVFDDGKARQALISDHIAKPFESQELISKVKKAVAEAGRQEPVPPFAQKPATTASKPPVQPTAPSRSASPAVRPEPVAPASKPKQAAADIFDIIEDAPSESDLRNFSAPVSIDEAIYEVEPVIEVEEPVDGDAAAALPEGEKAVEEMRAGLGLGQKSVPADEEIVSFESFDEPIMPAEEHVSLPQEPAVFDTKSFEAREYVPPPSEPVAALPEEKLLEIAGKIVERVAHEHFSRIQPPSIPEEKLNGMAKEIISGMAREHFRSMPPPKPPAISETAVQKTVEETVSRIVHDIARDVIEKVVWEVVPDLAATMIRAEIERLKAEQ